MSEAAHNSEGLVFHPMDQFIVRPLFGDDGVVGPLTFTNAALWMLVAVLMATLLFVVGTRGRSML